MLARVFAHPRDPFVLFDEPTHTYSIRGADGAFSSEGIGSVTGFIKRFYEEFDGPKIAAGIVARIARDPDNAPEKDRRYVGKTAEEIVQMWESAGDAASGLGTAMHLAIENFYNGDLPLDDAGKMIYPDSPEFKYFLAFNEEVVIRRGLKPFRTEMCVWDADRKLCGQIDMLYVKKLEGSVLTLALYDWKRAKEMNMQGFRGRMCKGICEGIPDSNYGHYSLQLNIYRWFILEHYRTGFKYEGIDITDVVIDEMVLVVLHPNFDNYRLFNVAPFGRINELMNTLLHAAKKPRA